MMIRNRYIEQSTQPADLVTLHMDLVRRVAHYMHGRVRGAVELEDLIQVGYIGLVDASRRYERKEGVSFESYALIRVRGAILDFLRRNSNLCRTTIGMRQRVAAAETALQRRHQRLPSPAEVASEVGISISELDEWTQAFQANVHHSLEEVYDEYSVWFATDSANPEEALSQGELKRALRKALETLPEREALVLQLYYVEELNVYEIAAILEITTGRVSQIKKAAIGRIRGRLSELLGEQIATEQGREA
jgi:RNA polymerase sigma factor for flagellar operon FliA